MSTRTVDEGTGEVIVECSACSEREEEITALRLATSEHEVEVAGLQHTIRSLSYKLEELKRDKEAEAREHELWDPTMDLFTLWLRAAECCERQHDERKTKAHKRSKLTATRFFCALPFLSKEGVEMCQQAIIGRVYQHFYDRRANGTRIRYFEFQRIFESEKRFAGAFEESANRRPTDWRERVEVLMDDEWMTAARFPWGVRTR